MMILRQFLICLLCWNPVISQSLQDQDLDLDIIQDIFGTDPLMENCISAQGHICSGIGSCDYGSCQCPDDYSGRFCETCQPCELKELCKGYQQCFACLALNYHWDDQEEYILPCEEECNKEITYQKVGSAVKTGMHNNEVCELQVNYGQCQSSFTIPDDQDVIYFTDLKCQASENFTVNDGLYSGQVGLCTNSVGQTSKQPNGFGQLWYEDTDFMRRKEYLGQFKCGQRHGRGFLEWQDGSYFYGHFQDGLKSGEGKMRYKNGDIYLGEWNKDTKNGQGTYRWNNGNYIFSGTFQDGKRKGLGEIYSIQDWNDSIFSGTYENDQKIFGKIKFFNGSSYEGGVKNDFMHGIGTYEDGKCGNTYDGHWQSGMRHGIGNFTWKNGDSYHGYFKDGLPHGNGTYIWNKTDLHSGTFLNGRIMS